MEGEFHLREWRFCQQAACTVAVITPSFGLRVTMAPAKPTWQYSKAICPLRRPDNDHVT